MKLFIGNLSLEITSEHLHSLFSGFGKVKSAHVALDGKGLSRGFGYVLMAQPAEAETAIQTLNKRKFMHQFISVSEAMQDEHIVRIAS